MTKRSWNLLLTEADPDEIVRWCVRAEHETDPVERDYFRNQFVLLRPRIENNAALFQRVGQAWDRMNELDQGSEASELASAVLPENRTKSRLLGGEDVSQPL